MTEEAEEIKKCTSCGKQFSTKLGLSTICGDCEDAIILKEEYND